jgi:transcription elongation GreA/GreB family factor
MKLSAEIKKLIHAKCLDLSQGKIDMCNQVLFSINEAKNADTKSSAGDKFETSREMLQAEEDRITATLTNAVLLKKSLSQINPDVPLIKVEKGALVIGSQMNYYISVGLGKIEFNGDKYWAISLTSPIAKEMFGKRKGERFIFNGKLHTITDII